MPLTPALSPKGRGNSFWLFFHFDSTSFYYSEFGLLTSVSFFTIFFLKKHLDYKELAEKGVCDETSDAFPVDARTPLSYNP